MVKNIKIMETNKKMKKKFFFLFSLGFTPSKAEQPLQRMELQEKEAQKD